MLGRSKIYLLLIFIIISIILIASGVILSKPVLLIMGIITVVVSTFIIILLSSISIFLKDKDLDFDKLIKEGFTVVRCKNCDKKNILEDKYCIFCGEDLL